MQRKKAYCLFVFLISVCMVSTMCVITGCNYRNNLKVPKADIPKVDIQMIEEKSKHLNDEFSGYSALNEDEKKAYLTCVSSLQNLENTINLSRYNLNVDSISKINDAIQIDCPEIFWYINYNYTYNRVTGVVNQITYEFIYDRDEILEKQREIDTVVKEIVSEMSDSMSDYEKVKYIHDYIIASTEYDESAPDNQNICSVIIGKRSVCAGYAKSMQYILNKIGIFCTTVSGDAVDRGPHAWNLVKMDDEYYYVDVTWDDPNFIGENTVSNKENYIGYAFFGLTSEAISATHAIKTNFYELPMFTATKDNYYVKEDLVFDLNSKNDIKKFLQRMDEAMNNHATSFSVKFVEDQKDMAMTLFNKHRLFTRAKIVYYYNTQMNIMTFNFDY